MIEQFLDALDEGREYDFISTNYSYMNKFELRSILLEYMYAVHSIDENFEEEVKECVSDELQSTEVFGK